MPKTLSFLALSALTALSACTTTTLEIPGTYVMDIQQGNIVTQDMIDQLRPNMNQKQVLYIMGSPMLADPFHQKRWDYLYSEQPAGDARMQKRISLVFEGDELIGVQGDFRPSSVPVLPVSKDVTIDVPKRESQDTLWDNIIALFKGGDEPPAAAAGEASAEKPADAQSGPAAEKTDQTEEAAQPAAAGQSEPAAGTQPDAANSESKPEEKK